LFAAWCAVLEVPEREEKKSLRHPRAPRAGFLIKVAAGKKRKGGRAHRVNFWVLKGEISACKIGPGKKKKREK